MFILRRITSELTEINECLGKNYVFINKDKDEAEFQRAVKPFDWEDEDIYGFISYDNGASFMPLYKKSQYYIMMSDGKTFDNISYR
jgi:hypothetical protein